MSKYVFLVILKLTCVASISHAQSNAQILNNIAFNVVTQTYVDLSDATGKLAVEIENFIANPNDLTLQLAQQAWRNARIPWECSEAFLFGPVDALGIDPMLDTWPLNRMDLEHVMRNSSVITTETVRALGTNLQGFHTLEYILFGNGLISNTKSINDFNPKQFQYLRATSILLAEYARKLSTAWTTNYDPEDPSTGGYVHIISKPGGNNPFYSSERAVLEEYIQGMLGILDEVGNGKISDPYGADANSANVELVESPYSWNSLADFNNNIRSVYNVYTGSYGSNKGPGIKDYISRANPVLANKVELKILEAMQAVINISGPEGDIDFGHAIKNSAGRIRIQMAIDKIAEVRNLIESEVLPLLD